MPLAGVELEMLKTVVHRFLTMKESTPRKLLVRRFKDPDALDHLVRSAVLKTHDTENFLPMVLAFEHCGDPDIQHFAKKSVEVVMHVLQHLLDVELEKTDFTPADVEEHASQMYDTIEPETIKLGLYLVQEFSGVLGGYGSKSPWEITSLRISERIVKLRNIDSAWDD